MTRTVAVSPNLIPQGDGSALVASLVGLAPAEEIRVSLDAEGRGPRLPQNARLELFTQYLDASASLELGFGGVVGFNAEAEASYVLCDLWAKVERPGSGGIIALETWGVSYRFVVKAWGLKADSSLTLSAIAASCTVEGAGSAFEAQVVGIPAGDLVGDAPSLMSVMGTFDMTRYQELGVLQTQLKQIIAAKHATLPTQLLSVDIDVSKVEAPYQNSPSTLLGLSGIQYGKSESEAASKAPSESSLPTGLSIDLSLVQEMYAALEVTATPSSEQQKLAAKSTFRKE